VSKYVITHKVTGSSISNGYGLEMLVQDVLKVMVTSF